MKLLTFVPQTLDQAIFLMVFSFGAESFHLRKLLVSQGAALLSFLRQPSVPSAVSSSCLACPSVPLAGYTCGLCWAAAQGETWLSSTAIS